MLLNMVDQLQRRLNGPSAAPQAESVPAAQAVVPSKTATPATQVVADRNIAAEDAYEDSIVLVKTPEDESS